MPAKKTIPALREGEEQNLFAKIGEKPDQLSLYRRLARLLAKRGRPEEAVYILKLALKRASSDRETPKLLARVLEEAGDLPRAVRVYRSLIRSNPQDYLPYERLARLYKKSGRKKEMLRVLKQVDGDHPHRERALKRIVSTYKDAGEYRSALRYLLILVDESGPDYGRLKDLGRFNEKLGHPRKAIAYYRRARRLKPESADIASFLGVCQRKNGKRKEARRVFHDMIPLKHGFYGGNIQLAEMDIEDGELDAAARRLARIDARWPDNSRVRLNRAKILLQRGDPEKALETALDAARSTPFYYTDELSLGYAVIGEARGLLGDAAAARYNLLMAERVRGSRDFFRAAFDLADELIASGELDLAEMLVDDLLGRFPDNSLACVRKAEILQQRGRLEDALKYAARASRESNPRYLGDKIRGLELLGELHQARGEGEKASDSRRLARELALRS